MARRKKQTEQRTGHSIYALPSIVERMAVLAESERRSTSAQIEIALLEHLERNKENLAAAE